MPYKVSCGRGRIFQPFKKPKQQLSLTCLTVARQATRRQNVDQLPNPRTRANSNIFRHLHYQLLFLASDVGGKQGHKSTYCLSCKCQQEQECHANKAVCRMCIHTRTPISTLAMALLMAHPCPSLWTPAP